MKSHTRRLNARQWDQRYCATHQHVHNCLESTIGLCIEEWGGFQEDLLARLGLAKSRRWTENVSAPCRFGGRKLLYCLFNASTCRC